MVSGTIGSFGTRRLLATGLGGAMLVVAVAVLAFSILAVNTRTALGSGGGGGCLTTVCTFKGMTAFADFQSLSTDGCFLTDAFASPFQNLTRPSGVRTAALVVAVSKFNVCTNTPVSNATNIDPSTGMPVFNGTIQFSTKLGAAAAAGSAPMFDSSTGAPLFTSTINMTWQGFGPTSTFIDNSHIRTPGFLLNSHFMGTSIAAEASGVLTDGASNLATAPTFNAVLENASSGTVTISNS
jgi:hypothetical protein